MPKRSTLSPAAVTTLARDWCRMAVLEEYSSRTSISLVSAYDKRLCAFQMLQELLGYDYAEAAGFVEVAS